MIQLLDNTTDGTRTTGQLQQDNIQYVPLEKNKKKQAEALKYINWQ